MKWIVRYHCGCTEDAPRKKDLLEYCGQHAGNAVEWIRILAKSELKKIRKTIK